MKRKIAIVTGSRAEYGVLKPLIRRIVESSDLELSLMVTGLHLLEEYGLTIELIKRDRFPIESIIEMYDEAEDPRIYYGSSLARAVKGFTLELSRISPDVLVVIGDRLEPLAAVLPAALLKIPIAHIHGGDRTDSGLIDESIRHSISRFASIHFVAISQHKERLLKMGEEAWRIHLVGSMALDTIVQKKPVSLAEISERIDFELDNQSILMVFHPVFPHEDGGAQMREIAQALKTLKLKTVILYPNNDLGNEEIIAEIEKLVGLPFIKIIKSLPHDDYIDLMKHVAVMIGNSSSGIIEAASIKLPVINIGSRQKSRGLSENIINVKAKSKDIIDGINFALYNDGFQQRLKTVTNPFGDGNSSQKIVEVLRKIEIDDKLLRKLITY